VPYDGSYVVLTERTAMKYFGRTDCKGEMLQNGNKRVAGVIKNYPANSELRFDFLSLSHSNYNPAGRSTFYVQLNRHAKVSNVREKIENHRSVAQTRFPGEEKNWSFNLRTLPEIHLNCNPQLKSRFQNINLLAIAGLLGLAGSLMNHLTLFTGQQQKRQRRNTAFRSMGASTSYLFLKSFIDLVIPLAIAATFSIFFINFLFPWYQSYTQWQGSGVYENYISKPEFNALILKGIKWIGLIAVIFMITGSLLIAGILRKIGKQAPFVLRRGLIICQVLIGSFFLFVALSLYKQFHFTQNKDKGIRVENIIQIDAGSGGSFDYLTLKEELLRSPYIEDVTFTSTTPVLSKSGEWYQTYITGMTVDDIEYSDISALVVEPNFFDFFGMKMKEGKWISESTDAVINESLMQTFGEKNMPGKSINIFGIGEGKISGVLCNYIYSTMQYPVNGLLFHLRGEKAISEYDYAYFKTQPKNRSNALEHARKILETQQNTVKVLEENQFLALTDIMDEFNNSERTLSMIFGILSLACILVVSFGIYSLIALTIEQRRREIAIRKVNGAVFADVLRLFFREYLLLVLIGNTFALTLGYYLMQRWFETYAYHTTLSWWIFTIVFVTTSVIVFLSVVGKINEAAKVKPAEALKYE
jgi:ABC-type antimicrobial peptide transport system permease subunit